MESRNNYIDFLRFIGLSLIILAHVHAPNIIHQIRCFDVPLMLFVSGLAYSNKKVKASWKRFYLPRIKKLLIPAYLFVLVDLAAYVLTNRALSTGTIIRTLFLCEDGAVGYIWIFRVFVLIMLVTPLLCKINRTLSYKQFWVLMLSLYALQWLIVWLMRFITTEPLMSVYRETLPYLVGYAILFMLGLRLRQADRKQENILLIAITIVSLAAVSLYYAKYHAIIEPTPCYKYPPQSYYIIYGLLASAALWKLRQTLNPLANSKLVLFIGRNTIWIYLWHIVFVTVANHLFESWLVKYILTYIFALLFYCLQYTVITRLKQKTQCEALNVFIG